MLGDAWLADGADPQSLSGSGGALPQLPHRCEAERRRDPAGADQGEGRLDGDTWVNLETERLWAGLPSGMTGATNPGEELAQLKFGFPQAVVEPDGSVFVVFWCEEDCIKNIRWLRVTV